MWSLGPEITKWVKIDPGNGDVAFPNPLTSNPSHICLYCLVCFTRGVRLRGGAEEDEDAAKMEGGPHRVLR